MSTEITIIIADDHPIVRQGLRQTIEREQDLKILAEAGDGKTALELIAKLQPQVVILDVDMPMLDGFGVAREVKNQNPETEIIFLTFHSEENYLNEALELGAKGYLLKDSAITDIVACLRAVTSGQNYISPTLTTYLINRTRKTETPSDIGTLSPTERQILKLLADYKTSKEIASELHISPHTVNTHRANIALKLNLRGSHALMKFALDNKSKL
jgi:DNA-binding NarL/FixJ family response regulator